MPGKDEGRLRVRRRPSNRCETDGLGRLRVGELSLEAELLERMHRLALVHLAQRRATELPVVDEEREQRRDGEARDGERKRAEVQQRRARMPEGEVTGNDEVVVPGFLGFAEKIIDDETD